MRRRRSSLLEDLLVIAAKLPWWLSVTLAVASYFFLHSIAITKLASPAGLHDVGNALADRFFKLLAGIGQYLLPGIFLLGVVISAIQRRMRSSLFENIAARSEVGALNRMSWRKFEVLVGEAFRRRGYQVEETGGQGPDGGIDLVLRKDNERFLVQCKRWRAFKVGVSIVRELYGVMAAEGVTGGFVVTSGKFTQEAEDFARGRNIELIDGVGLLALIQEVRTAGQQGSAQPGPSSNLAINPVCPQCGSPMVKRVAKQGPNVGSQFLGCSKFPVCRGTRAIS